MMIRLRDLRRRSAGNSWKLALALLCVVGTSVGCDITSFGGPGAVGLAQRHPYTVDVSNAGSTVGEAFDLHIMLRVPSGWTVASKSYSGKESGSPISGTPTQSGTNPSSECDFAAFFGSTPSGLQDLWFSRSFADSDAGDTGTLTVEFMIGGATGLYDMRAATGMEFPSATVGGCVDTLTRSVRVNPGFGIAIPTAGPLALFALVLGVVAVAAVTLRRRPA